MINLKFLSTAAALALAVSMVPDAGWAQGKVAGGSGMKGGMAMGGARAGAAPGGQFSGGVGMKGGPGAFQGGSPSGPQFSGGSPSGRQFSGGNWRGHRGNGGGFFPGAVAGAVIGGALASQAYYGNGYYGGGYYDSPGYYAPGYYDDQYYDSGAVAVAPAGGDDSVAYCAQTYRSYDPRSGTYLGFDGYRHPCP